MREWLIKIGTRVAEAYANNQYPLASALGRMPGYVAPVIKAQQINLMLQYRELARRDDPLPDLRDVEMRVYSQNGEDGILLHLFALIGFENRRAIEICCGSGIDCNATNLIVNHGFEALLIDGQKKKMAMGRKFYARCRDTNQWPPTLASAWVTAENVNAIVKKYGFDGEIDLFTLDMDGVDYWVWKALDVISPRVVVVEYQDILGPERSVTVPYDPKFVAKRGPLGPDYCGASLRAFVNLAREKGYRLIGTQAMGYNAFFLRNDVGAEHFPEVPVESGFTHPRTQMGQEKRFPNVKDLAWEEV